MKKQLSKERVFYFKRWSRKKYAAFSSLKKLVVIASVSMSCSFLTKPTTSIAQSSSDSNRVMLEEITISAEEFLPETDGLSRTLLRASMQQSEIERVPVSSVNQLLKQLPGFDIRQRGPFATQADISYRGGNFDQTMLLLNGVNFTDPQTGHYSLNLPISPDIIHKIELFNNTTSFLFGASPFSGLLNIVTKPERKNSLSLHLSGGMYGYFNGMASLNLKTGKLSHLIAVNHNRSDGYRHNTDFSITNIFYHLHGDFKKGTLEFQTGYTDKEYGANGFYSLRFPDQYESTETFLTSVSWHKKGRVDWKPTLYYRNNRDCFELIKGQPKENNNYHITHVAGFNFLTSLKSRIGKTSLSVDVRGENVTSTSLGEKLRTPIYSSSFDINFTHARARMTSGVALAHTYARKRWEVDISALFNCFFDMDKKFYLLPAVNVNYHFLQKEKESAIYLATLHWGAASTVRRPTFTDLYYKTGDIVGNSNLLPEKAFTAEMGTKFQITEKNRTDSWLITSASFFTRYGRDMIDYVKHDQDVMWQVINHTDLIFLGTELQMIWKPNNYWNKNFPVTQVALHYSYLFSDKESRGYQSRYILDHLVHNFTVLLNHRIWKDLTIDYTFSYRKRKGEYLSYEVVPEGQNRPFPSYCLLDVRLNYQYSVAKFYLEISNLLNHSYFDIGGVQQPGIWILGGVKCNIGL